MPTVEQLQEEIKDLLELVEVYREAHKEAEQNTHGTSSLCRSVATCRSKDR